MEFNNDDLDGLNLEAMEAMFTDDLMGFEDKMKFIVEIVHLNKKFTSLYSQMCTLRDKAVAGQHQKDPFTLLCVKAFLQSESEYGDLIAELKDAIRDIHDRLLYECNGNSEIVLGLQEEFAALRPKIEKLDAHFSNMRDQIMTEKQQILQSN